MPRLDGTGPEGKGPRTGRGMGNCRFDERDFRTRDGEEFLRGGMFGRGRGRRGGRGFRNNFR